MRKKIFSLIIVLLLASAFLLSLAPLSAKSDNIITMSGDESICRSNTYYGYVYIETLENVAALNVSLHYDPSVIEITGTYNQVSCTMYDNSLGKDELSYSYLFDGNGGTDKTCLFTFYYTVKDDAPIGRHMFDLTVNEAYDFSFESTDVKGSRFGYSVSAAKQEKSCYIYGTGNVSSQKEMEFELSYSFDTTQVASGAIEIQYDKNLFEFVSMENGGFLNGKIVDINTKQNGTVYLSFLGTEYAQNTDILRVRFKTIGNVTQTSQIKFKAADLYDLDLSHIRSGGFSTDVNLTYNSAYDDTSANMSLRWAHNIENNQVKIYVKLSENTRLGAGDFTLSWDASYLKLASYQKLFEPTYFNVNTQKTESGILKFSIISLTDITDAEDILCLVFDVEKTSSIPSVDFGISASGLSDSLTSPISLNMIGCILPMAGEHEYGEWTVVTPATCITKGIEHRICSRCQYEDTREIPVDSSAHNYEQKHDENSHWLECPECHSQVGYGAHIFDSSCDTTCDTCGYTRSITHNYEQKYDENSHWNECSICHERKDITAHIFDNACDTTCDTCGYTRSITHSYEQKYDENSHWDECRVCGDKQNVTAHIFDSSCDRTCDTCGYTRAITHNYEQKHDEDSHWDECTVCGDKQNVTAHIFDNACDTTCDTCGYTRAITHSYEQKHDENSHWDECTVCGDKQNITAHIFDNACDTTCDTCGYTRSITHSYEQKYDENSHWDECRVCGDKQNVTAHIFDSSCDRTCDTCGYTRAITHNYEQKHDEDSHWDECTVCGDKQNVTAHIFDNACDTTCDTCGYTRAITHNYEQKHDEDSHWDECTVCGDKQNIKTHTNTKNKHICDTCGRKLSNHEGGTATCSEKAICTICGEKYGNFAEHSFGEWKTNAEGKRTKVCSACGKVANFMYGDLNYDGKVNAIDLTILRRYLARYSSEIDIAVADFNGDGKVNTLDLMLLRRFIVGYDSVLGK